MAIYEPGQKFRHSFLLSKRKGGREVVALLSLTAMVDMFTVLVIFLLQNFGQTGEVIYIPKEVELPRAQAIKELKPSLVVTISNKELLFDKQLVAQYQDVVQSESLMIEPLFKIVSRALEEKDNELNQEVRRKIKKAMERPENVAMLEDPALTRKITVQADKNVDFLTVKKIMYTITEAGAVEINFAVVEKRGEKAPSTL